MYNEIFVDKKEVKLQIRKHRHSHQVCGLQKARVYQEDATNVEQHITKVTGFLSISSPQSKEQDNFLSGVLSC